MQKIKITSQIAHFGEVLGCDDRLTHETPPPSTVIGILKVLFGEEICDFVFGYTFKSACKFKDDLIIYKHSNAGYARANKKSPVTTDCRNIENHFDCELLIYTDLKEPLKMDHIICLGKAGNPARVHLPFKEVELKEQVGLGYNQYTPKSIGKGIIKPVTLMTEYSPKFNSYNQQVEHLRLNTEFEYDKNYDEDECHNIVLWHYKDGGVKFYD